jgi:alpha-glucosidase
MGGINSENKEKRKTINFAFLKNGEKYKLTLITDGKHDKDFTTQYLVVDNTSTVEVKMLRRGGFAANLKPIH